METSIVERMLRCCFGQERFWGSHSHFECFKGQLISVYSLSAHMERVVLREPCFSQDDFWSLLMRSSCPTRIALRGALHGQPRNSFSISFTKGHSGVPLQKPGSFNGTFP